MKKPNYNPLFYSYFIYDFSIGGSKGGSSKLGYSSSEKSTKPRLKESGGEKVLPVEISSARQDCKSTQDMLIVKLKETLKEADETTYNKMSAQINSYYTKAAYKFSRHITKEKFRKVQAEISKKTIEFRRNIENLSELINHKELSKKEIKKISENTMDEFVDLWSGNSRYSKNCEFKHLVYLASGYLLRWEVENSKAIDRITDNDVAGKVYSDLTVRKGGKLFKDLDAIKRDIMEAYDRWADKEDRSVYSKSNWDTEYEKTMHWTQKSRVTGSNIGIEGARDFLQFARLQAEKGKYPPLPDMLRSNGRRVRAIITPAIKPAKIKETLKFYTRAAKYIKSIAEAGLDSNINFKKPSFDEDTNEASVKVYNRGKSVGKIDIGTNGKIILNVGKKKIDITALNAKDVIKKIEDLSLNPRVEEVKVVKTGGSTTLKIVGENLPSGDPLPVDLSLGAIKLATLASGKVDVRLAPNLGGIDASIKSILTSALKGFATYAVSDKFAKQLKPKITPKLVAELQEKIFTKTKKPQLVVTGKASLEGNFNKNKKLADKRAKSALEKLKAKYPDFERNFNVRTASIVAGPDGKPVTSESEGWNKMLSRWNMYMASNPRVQKLTLAELKKKMKSPRSKAEKQFFDENFKKHRGADMIILPAKELPQSFNIAMKNTTSTESEAVEPEARLQG